jgi:hypothetical protein
MSWFIMFINLLILVCHYTIYRNIKRTHEEFRKEILKNEKYFKR